MQQFTNKHYYIGIKNAVYETDLDLIGHQIQLFTGNIANYQFEIRCMECPDENIDIEGVSNLFEFWHKYEKYNPILNLVPTKMTLDNHDLMKHEGEFIVINPTNDDLQTYGMISKFGIFNNRPTFMADYKYADKSNHINWYFYGVKFGSFKSEIQTHGDTFNYELIDVSDENGSQLNYKEYDIEDINFFYECSPGLLKLYAIVVKNGLTTSKLIGEYVICMSMQGAVRRWLPLNEHVLNRRFETYF